jgi:hypothetical protein
MLRPLKEEGTHLIHTVSTSGEDLSPIIIFSQAATQSWSKTETCVVLRNCFGTWTRVVAMMANNIAAYQPYIPQRRLRNGLTPESWFDSIFSVVQIRLESFPM